MFRRALAARAPASDPVRWRSDQPNRIEGLSDAVFGFAITLLVLSLEVPRTYAALVDLVWGVPAFLLSFSVIAILWWRHCKFFRRYGLSDRTTATLNAVLLFLVVIYVYPLKFLFDYAFATMFDAPRSRTMITSFADARGLITIYGAGFASVLAMISGLYFHAYRCRVALELTDAEAQTTVHDAIDFAIAGSAGILVIALATLVPDDAIFLSQLAMLIIPISRRVRRRRLRATVAVPVPRA
jgi:hypothetical protein